MTNEERDIIARFIARVGGGASGFAPGSAPASAAGSVPATQPALPPVDTEADAYIGQLFAQYPAARYRITQMAFVQEAALAEAQNRIQRLQWELDQTRQNQPRGGGLFSGLFGGGGQQRQQYQAPPPPPPQYAPGMAQPGMFQQGGTGFLGSALTTAAGVAGGMMVGNALMDLFTPHHGVGGMGGDGFGGGFAGPQETVVNNYYGQDAAATDPWGGAGVMPPDQTEGYWSKDDAYSNAPQAPDPGWGDAGQAAPDWDNGNSWDDSGSDTGGDNGGW